MPKVVLTDQGIDLIHNALSLMVADAVRDKKELAECLDELKELCGLAHEGLAMRAALVSDLIYTVEDLRGEPADLHVSRVNRAISALTALVRLRTGGQSGQ